MRTLPGSVADDDAPPDELAIDPWLPSRWSDSTKRRVELGIDIAIIAILIGFVLLQLGPRNLVSNTTPTGGDNGGHVWGPAFLRDHLLPSFRLSGWTPDWYDGFPAYQFYMVVPALLIVALNAGIHGWAALLPAAIALGLAIAALLAPGRSLRRRLCATAAVLVALFGIGFSYGVSYKLVTVVGVLAMPLCAYALGKLAGLPFPTPAFLAIGSLIFLFNREPVGGNTGSIIGGNFTSTMAGEFSFSIALAAALLFLGLVIHGLRTGRRRWQAALCLAVVLTCHLIVGIFALVAAALAFIVWPGVSRLKVLAPSLIVGGLLSAFWTVPFVLRGAYVNDMGWEKSPTSAIGHPWTDMLFNPTIRSDVLDNFIAPRSLYFLIALAVVGAVVSIVLRIRFGWWLAAVTLTMAIGFVVCPEARLWNARILPFYYLGLALLAGLAISELVRALAILTSREPTRSVYGLSVAAPWVGLGIVLLIVGLPLGVVPGETRTANAVQFGPINWSTTPNPARDWATYNYTGYEQKPGYAEYYGFVTTFAQVGRDHGCGRAMWEYDDTTLNAYGSPMAPMLLPFWTDGCIGSMEGVYFESATTTPFHFVNQDELSAKCSCAQRNLPYQYRLDMHLGVEHLQMLGVRYYAAVSKDAVAAADAEPALTAIATTGPWHIYQVADSDLVTPLQNEPAVITHDNGGLQWVYGTSDPHGSKKDANGQVVKANGPAMNWYLDPSSWSTYLAASGPSSWTRVAPGETPPTRPLPPVTISNTSSSTDSISFDVDRVGVPVLVRTSFFPNWQADGADGPYRVTPNLMVVIPRSNHVHLHYGLTAVDWLGDALTVLGVIGLVLLARFGALRVPDPEPASDLVLERMLQPGDEVSPTEETTEESTHDAPAEGGARRRIVLMRRGEPDDQDADAPWRPD